MELFVLSHNKGRNLIQKTIGLKSARSRLAELVASAPRVAAPECTSNTAPEASGASGYSGRLQCRPASTAKKWPQISIKSARGNCLHTLGCR